MKVLVIPDVHLKPTMFEKATKILESKKADIAVQLGDIADEWDADANEYMQTFAEAIKFAKQFPETKWCWGNHDYAYYVGINNISGHQFWAEFIVQPALKDINKISEIKVAHKIDSVIFSHAGISCSYVERNCKSCKDIDEILEKINMSRSEELWKDDSPLWVRPQFYDIKMIDKVQVVGHSPLERIDKENNLISTDTFSTYSNRAPIGEEKFIIIDSVSGEFEYAD